MTTIFKRLTVCLAVALICLTASAQNYELISKQVIPSDTTVRKGVLRNGLSYFVRRVTKKSENKANLYLLVRGGACTENEDEHGLAHLVEHMMYTGTKHFPGNSVRSFLGNHGLNFGEDGNAFTTFFAVQYVIQNLDYKNYETLDTCLNIFHDMSTDATFDKQSLEKEKAIVEEEMRMYSVRNTKGNDALYNINNLEIPHVVGDTVTLRHCTQEKIRAYYKRVYQPQNLAVVVVGDIDADKMVEMIKKKFGDLKKGTNKTTLPVIAHPDRNEPKMTFVKDPRFMNSNIATFVQLWDFHPHKKLTIGSLRDKTIMEVIDHNFAMMTNHVKGKEEMLAVENFLFDNSMKVYHQNTTVGRGGDWKKALEVYFKCTEKIRRMKFSEENLSFPPDSIKFNADSTAIDFAKYYNDHHDAKEWYEYIFNSFVFEEEITSSEQRHAAMAYLKQTLKPEELDEAFKRLTDGHNTTIIISLPEDAEDPTMEEENAIRERVMKMSDNELEEKHKWATTPKIIPEKINLKSVPGKVIKKKKRKDGFTEILLSNGVKVLMKENRDSCAIIHCKFQRPSGLYPYGLEYKGGCNFMFNLCWRKVEGFDYSHKDFFDECSFTTGTEIAEASFKAMHIGLTTTEVDSAEFRNTSNRLININELRKSPLNEKFNRVLNFMYCKDRRNLSELEIISNLSMDKYQQMLKDSRSNYNGSAMVIYGNFKIKDMLPLVTKYVGSLPSTKTPVKITADVNDHLNNHDEKLILDIKNDVPYGLVFSSYTVDQGYEFTQENQATIEILSLALQKLTFTKIREENKDAYAPVFQIIVQQFPYHRAVLLFNTNCSPEKIDKVVMDFDNLLRNAANGELLTQDLIDECIKERLNSRKANTQGAEQKLAEKEFLALERELYGVAIDQDEHIELMKKVTAESLRTLLRSLLSKSHHQVSGLSTEAK